jgi:hypothetical protein
VPPDGLYEGVWGGYTVEMTVMGCLVTFQTNNGVRGMNVPVYVQVKDGVATVREKLRGV